MVAAFATLIYKLMTKPARGSINTLHTKCPYENLPRLAL